MWDESKSLSEVIKGRFALSVKCTTVCKKPCWISNVYDPTLHQERKLIWSELNSPATLRLDAWCVVTRLIKERFPIGKQTRA